MGPGLAEVEILPGKALPIPRWVRCASATQLVEDTTDEPCRLGRLGRGGRLLAIAERLENRLHFSIHRKAAGLGLRENQRVIDENVELTGRARRDFGSFAIPPFE